MNVINSKYIRLILMISLWLMEFGQNAIKKKKKRNDKKYKRNKFKDHKILTIFILILFIFIDFIY